jgi:flagellar biosynthesis GTPase FlhF
VTLGSAAGAGDVLSDLKISKKDAATEAVQSIAGGHVNTYRVRSVFKAASPAMRAALVEQTLIWTKAYVNSAQFAKDYAAYREQAKPQPPERTTTVDEELAERRKERQEQLAEAKKNVAEMPAEYRKIAEDGYKAAVEAMKQMDTPEFRKMERDGIVMQRRQEDDNHEERLAEWEEQYPADPKELVKMRLEQFLEATEDVDFDATLNGRKFADKQYERKPQEWKLAYRAGREPVEKARAFAEAWLKEM